MLFFHACDTSSFRNNLLTATAFPVLGLSNSALKAYFVYSFRSDVRTFWKYIRYYHYQQTRGIQEVTNTFLLPQKYRYRYLTSANSHLKTRKAGLSTLPRNCTMLWASLCFPKISADGLDICSSQAACGVLLIAFIYHVCLVGIIWWIPRPTLQRSIFRDASDNREWTAMYPTDRRVALFWTRLAASTQQQNRSRELSLLFQQRPHCRARSPLCHCSGCQYSDLRAKK